MLLPDLTTLLQIVSALNWSTFTLIYNGVETEEAWYAQFLERLQGKDGVSPVMVSWSALTALTAPNGSRTCLPAVSAAFLVLGRDAFVLDVFAQVAGCTQRNSQTYKLISTEWIAVTSLQNLSRVATAARSFENCALVAFAQTGNSSLWTLRREGEESELSFVTSLPAVGPCLARHRVLPNPDQGLGGRTLRVAIKPWGSVLSLRRGEGGQDVYDGLVMDIFTALQTTLNFSYTVIPRVDDSWGQELDSGQWDGLIGMLIRQEIDLAVGFFTITADRSRVVDAAAPFLYDNTAIVFRTPAADLDNSRFFLKPFQTTVYVVVAVTFVSVLLMLLLLDICQDRMLEEGRTAGQGDNTVARRMLGRVLFNVEILMAGLINRASSQETASRTGRFLVVTWLMLGVILTSLYSSQLTSTLTVGRTPIPFTSLAQLLQQDGYKFGVAAGTAEQALLQTSTVKEHRQFYQKVLEEARTDPDVLSTDILVHKNKTLQGNFASLQGSRLLSSMWQSESCGQLTFLPEQFRTASFGFYLQRGSPYTRAVSQRIDQMVNAGLVTHWKETQAPRGVNCSAGKGQSARGVRLADTYTAFCLVAAGLGLATIVLGVEILALRNTFCQG